jgi:hypothetical protein
VILGFPFITKSKLRIGLQSFYKLSNTSDSSGNNHTLTNNGGVTFAAGKIGNAAVFNGTNSLERTPFNIGTNFSVSFWAKPAVVANYKFFVIQYIGFAVYMRADGSIEVGDAATWNFATVAGLAVVGVYAHYCLSVSNGLGTLFVNNINRGNSDGKPPLDLQNVSDRPFGISGDSISGGFINGQVDAVGIWNRALSDAEVALLYNNGTGIEIA